MKTFLYGVVLAALVAGAGPARAAASGTAWGYQVGPPSCLTFNPATSPEHRCFLTLRYPNNPDTVVTCRPPLDGWCGTITDGKTVIVSFDEQTVHTNNGQTSDALKVLNGITLTTY